MCRTFMPGRRSVALIHPIAPGIAITPSLVMPLENSSVGGAVASARMILDTQYCLYCDSVIWKITRKANHALVASGRAKQQNDGQVSLPVLALATINLHQVVEAQAVDRILGIHDHCQVRCGISLGGRSANQDHT